MVLLAEEFNELKTIYISLLKEKMRHESELFESVSLHEFL